MSTSQPIQPDHPEHHRPDRSRAVYVISVAAELAGVHPQTLRIYERKGLLDPSRTIGGARRFSDVDLARLRRIQQLTTEGLNLEGVRRVLALEAETAALRAELDATRRAATVALEQTHRQYRRDLVPLNQATVLYAKVRTGPTTPKGTPTTTGNRPTGSPSPASRPPQPRT